MKHVKTDHNLFRREKRVDINERLIQLLLDKGNAHQALERSHYAVATFVRGTKQRRFDGLTSIEENLTARQAVPQVVPP